MAIGFARADFEVENQYLFSADSHQAMTRLYQGRRGTSAGGKATAELTSYQHVLLLKTTYAKHRDQVKAIQKTANELYDRHKIKSRRGGKIAERTVRRRLKELGILDNAKRCH
jgi:hypothetical protein